MIPVKDTTPLFCKCGSEVFKKGFLMRGVSAVLSPTGKDEVSPADTYYCVKCLSKFVTHLCNLWITQKMCFLNKFINCLTLKNRTL